MRFINPRITPFIISLVIAFIGLGVLYHLSPLNRSFEKQGFIRNLSLDFAHLISSTRLPYNGMYIAGTDSHSVFIAHPRMISTQWTLYYATSSLYVQEWELPEVDYKNARLQVVPPYVYLTDGNVPFYYCGFMESKPNHLSNKTFTPFFLLHVPLSPGSSIVMSRVNGRNTLGKTDSLGQAHFVENLLEEQLDGFFSTYGQLHADKNNNTVVYVYLYRNQFLVMDSTLNLVKRANTIDTTSQAKIRIRRTNTNTFTHAAPSLVVNRNSDLHNGKLFVQSNLRADNEDPEHAAMNTVIDIYDVRTGKYLRSFYMPKVDQKPPADFRVLNDHYLAAIYGSQVVVWSFQH